MSTIVKKIQDRSNRFEREPQSSINDGKDFQDKAIKAVLAGKIGPDGKVTKDWHEYMLLHVSNPTQLRRLRGEDEVFNALPYARKVLAYILGNGTCSVDTRARTIANLDEEMIFNLDKDLPEDELPIPPYEEF
jgi:hypothetical protein